jgi:fido (protein-threonine AMPylation protein)
MPLDPDYGETVLSYEEAEALTPQARTLLGDPIRKADLYDLEQRIQVEVADEWWANLLNFNVPMQDLLNDHYVRDLHRRLYAPVWVWGGRLRSRETNIGIAPERIAVELRNALDDLSYQWLHQTGIDARTLGIATHAALVRIHPFVDGNGRVTRLLADLVYLAGQTGWHPIHAYD